MGTVFFSKWSANKIQGSLSYVWLKSIRHNAIDCWKFLARIVKYLACFSWIYLYSFTLRFWIHYPDGNPLSSTWPSHKFQDFPDMTHFYSSIWLHNIHSRIFKLHYTVDLSKLPDHLYYEAYIQTLEIRRVKFKPALSHRCKKFFLELMRYIELELANQVFEYNQKVSGKPLTPYEYILFH